jgi:hypothetical protein
VTVRKRGRRLLLIAAGVGLGLVLGAFALALSIVNEDAPYAFMRGARQDGFSAPILGGSPTVVRFYVLEGSVEAVQERARLELTSAEGWVEKGLHDGTIVLSSEQTTVWIEPLPGEPRRTSVMVIGDAKKPEELLGTVYESVPGRHSEMRL